MSDFDISKELKEFEENLINYGVSELESIKEDCILIYRIAVWDGVYDYYEPTWYSRTYQLILSVTGKIVNNALYVYNDVDKLDYTSAVDGRYVSFAVPYWVQSGHDDDVDIYNQYHHYEGRGYLDLASDMIKAKYGIESEIINKQPPQWF